ncbi:MAG: hypothetical protein Rubg2KO_37500 [Rubricoccaceae bacterium]
MRDHTHSAPAFHAMALVAAARAALGAARTIADRREGRDASEQEDERLARADLHSIASSIAELTVRLRLRVVTGTPETEAAALAQAFEDRLLLDDLSKRLRLAHQKQLSLYPEVSETLIETTRQLAADAARLSTADVYEQEWGELAIRVSDWLDAV